MKRWSLLAVAVVWACSSSSTNNVVATGGGAGASSGGTGGVGGATGGAGGVGGATGGTGGVGGATGGTAGSTGGTAATGGSAGATGGAAGSATGGSSGTSGAAGASADASADATTDAALDAGSDATPDAAQDGGDASIPVPLAVSGCILWLDPMVGVSTSSGKVTSWKNLGTAGSALDVAQSVSAKQPQLIANATPAGGPALRFTQSDQTGLVSPAHFVAQPSTVVAVVKRSDTDAGSSYQSVTDGLDLNTRRLHFAPGGALIYSTPSGFTATTATNVWHVYTAVFDGQSSSLRVDTAAAKAGSVGTGAATGISIGDCPDSVSCTQDLEGDLADVLLYDRALSDNEAVQVASYLRNKNGF